jgi:hypothetical protein
MVKVSLYIEKWPGSCAKPFALPHAIIFFLSLQDAGLLAAVFTHFEQSASGCLTHQSAVPYTRHHGDFGGHLDTYGTI